MNRRQAIGHALLTGLGLAAAPAIARAQGAQLALIAPPSGPMRYARRLSRELAGGASLTVERQFTVTFSRMADGFMVHGRQTAVMVEAPAPLARFAEIERGRDESGLFPLALDPFGQLLDGGDTALPADIVARAVAQAEAALRSQPIPASDQAALASFVSAFHQAGASITAELPVDLFAPTRPLRSETRTLGLPGGAAGEVVTLFEAARDPATGLMRTARREVVTALADDRRTAREDWRLEPA